MFTIHGWGVLRERTNIYATVIAAHGTKAEMIQVRTCGRVLNSVNTSAQKKKGTVQGRCLSGFETLRGDAGRLKPS